MQKHNTDYTNRMRFAQTFRAFASLVVIFSMAIGLGTASVASEAAAVEKKADSPIISKCKADLAKRLEVKAESISVVDVNAVIWPDAALGMPESGKVYAQVQTPGSKVILEAKNLQYLYTTSAKTCRYGGPVQSWSYSVLYLKPVPGEPNLNSDLYQSSLLGTNTVRLVSEVTDYYPQDKGVVIIKRRTSRSTHDLLYIKADDTKKEKMIHQAFDFGAAAFNASQDRWASFVRPGVGTKWVIVVGSVGGDTSAAKTLPLPDGFKPGRVAWSDDQLVIQANEGNKLITFEINPSSADATWKSAGPGAFPGQDDYLLNKSEHLEIEQITESGKSSVEVARVWFTGDRTVLAKISDFTMQNYDIMGPYVFVFGEKESRPAAYAVAIRSGQTISSFPQSGRNIQPFAYPPHNSPLAGLSVNK